MCNAFEKALFSFCNRPTVKISRVFFAIIRGVRSLIRSLILLLAAIAFPGYSQNGQKQANQNQASQTQDGQGQSEQKPDDQNRARHAAIQHAFDFLHRTATNPVAFAGHGGDLMWAFYTIGHTSSDPELRASALRLARQAAAKWRKAHRHLPADANADTIGDLVATAYVADLLGFPNPAYKEGLRRAARKFTMKDYLGFDAVHGPLPSKQDLRVRLWHDALLTTRFGDAYGITLGTHYQDVAKWLPCMRPYATSDETLEFDLFYAVTHYIYMVNWYNSQRVDPALLPDEVAFIKRILAKSITEEGDDPEMAGEALDTLKAFGLESDPLVQKGIEYLLESQLPTGEWLSEEDRDLYTAYHSAWTGIDGLRDYRYRGTVTSLPPMVQVCQASSDCPASSGSTSNGPAGPNCAAPDLSPPDGPSK
jgi:hypothetical protein